MRRICRIFIVTKNDPPSNELLRLLGIELATTGKRAAAAIQALSEEVLHLQAELAESQRQLESAETEADRDTLVPVFNRRAFERELVREISVAERYGSSLCIVFIDLDRFKLVNDRFGHSAGDAALIRVGEILAANTRETDIVGRLGGDEFAIALTHAEYDDCLIKAKALSEQIAHLTVRDTADETLSPVQIGASYGVSEWTKGSSAASLLAEADAAMFTMKARRRNRGQD